MSSVSGIIVPNNFPVQISSGASHITADSLFSGFNSNKINISAFVSNPLPDQVLTALDGQNAYWKNTAVTGTTAISVSGSTPQSGIAQTISSISLPFTDGCYLVEALISGVPTGGAVDPPGVLIGNTRFGYRITYVYDSTSSVLTAVGVPVSVQYGAPCPTPPIFTISGPSTVDLQAANSLSVVDTKWSATITIKKVSF